MKLYIDLSFAEVKPEEVLPEMLAAEDAPHGSQGAAEPITQASITYKTLS